MSEISGKYALEHPDIEFLYQELLEISNPQSIQDFEKILSQLKTLNEFIYEGYRCSLFEDTSGYQHSLLDGDAPNLNQKNKNFIAKLEKVIADKKHFKAKKNPSPNKKR